MNSSIEKYRRFCRENNDLPVFFKDWWLDAAAGKDNWFVQFVEEDGSINACLPYIIKTKAFLKSMGIPEYTPFLGAWICSNTNDTTGQDIKREQILLGRLLSQLPKFDKYYIKLSTEIQSAEAFVNQKFQKTDCYTYILNNIRDHERILSGFKPSNRSKIRQAEGKIKVVKSDDIQTLFNICELSMKRQSLDIPYSYKRLEKIYKAAKVENSIQILLAKDEEERVHAGALLVWDQKRAYYLMGGNDPELRKHGANTLLLWEAIKFSSQHAEQFDFEGSMIAPIEKFFKSFGATRQPYYLMTKTSSKLIKTAQIFKDILKR